MKKIWYFIKFLFITLYLIGISYLMIRNEYLSPFNNILNWIIPIVFFISIFLFWYFYLKLRSTITKLENEFISIVNHTFRTPLTGISWGIKEMEKDITQNEKLLYLQKINNLTNKLIEIVDLFVGIKKIDDMSSYYFKAISIREIIEKSIIKYKKDIIKKNITFQISSFKNIPLLTLDLKKIHFVIDATIENAIFYTPPNGKILIDCISAPKKITFFISDTGIGLSLVDKMRIFSKFYRGSKAKLINTDGMGLRLYLSKKIIQRHKGKMYFKSKGKDKGTTFFIELPFNK